MEQFYTPWRYEYVTRRKDGSGCVLCDVATTAADDDASVFVIHRGESFFVVLNIYPYNTGHLMVVPYAHHARLAELPVETLGEMMELARRAEALLSEVYRPDGINMGLNLGRCSGAGIGEHLHLHVLPRWCGDTGFITITGGARVMPEDLHETWRKLHGRL
jgi:ATP adenylyltransferase